MKAIVYSKEFLFYSIATLFIFVTGFSILNTTTIPVSIFLALTGFIGLILNPSRLFWLMLFSIPFSVEYIIPSSISTDFPDELFMISLTGISFLIISFNPFHSIKTAIKHPFILLIAFQLLWIIITLFFSTYPILSIKYFIAKIWYIVPFIFTPQVVLQDKSTFKTLAATVILPISLIAIYALYQHAGFGFSFLSINGCLQPFFRNHVNYAAMLSFAFSICFVVYLKSKAIRYRNHIGFLLIILTFALFFSYTRGSWLSVIISIIGLVLFWQSKLMTTIVVTFLFIVSLFAIFIVNDNYLVLKPSFEKTIVQNSLSKHLNSMYSNREISGAERIHRWVAGVKMIAEKPITGFGPACYYNNYKPYTDKRFRTYVSENPEKSSVHNYYLLIWIEQGFIGFLFLLISIYYFFKRCTYLYHSMEDPYYKQVLSILVMVMINILVVNFFSDMIETDKVGTFFFLCIGVLIWIDSQFQLKKIA
jgi:O-antigen ligase